MKIPEIFERNGRDARKMKIPEIFERNGRDARKMNIPEIFERNGSDASNGGHCEVQCGREQYFANF